MLVLANITSFAQSCTNKPSVAAVSCTYQTKYNQDFARDSLLVWSGARMEVLASAGRFSRPVAGVEFAASFAGGTLLFLVFCSLCQPVPLKST